MIMEFSNKKFYEGKLEAHDSVKDWHLSQSPLPLEFIDTAGCGFEEKTAAESDSKCNPEEVKILRSHYDQLTADSDADYTVGIISPYRAQVELLQSEFAGIP